ncbi:MAG: hypothetical protein V2I33_25125, partial [Kangiellaceae bacterium]|nr:hypothetical protein [Kangiellaceae bacterium]
MMLPAALDLRNGLVMVSVTALVTSKPVILTKRIATLKLAVILAGLMMGTVIRPATLRSTNGMEGTAISLNKM